MATNVDWVFVDNDDIDMDWNDLNDDSLYEPLPQSIGDGSNV